MLFRNILCSKLLFMRLYYVEQRENGKKMERG